MTNERTEAEDSLADLVRELTGAVQVLSDRFRRKRVSDAVLGIVVAVLATFVGLYYFVELPDRRADTNTKISDLACYAVRLRPPGYSPTSDALRARYHCPPYDPSLATLTPGTPSTEPTPTPATTGRGAQRPSAGAAGSAVPSAQRTPGGTRAGRTASARPAASSTRRPVAPTGGRDASATSSTPLIQLPSIPLCSLRVAGIGICRSS